MGNASKEESLLYKIIAIVFVALFLIILLSAAIFIFGLLTLTTSILLALIFDIPGRQSNVSQGIGKNPDSFTRCFRFAFLSVALDLMKPDTERTLILQNMYRTTKESKFDNLYNRLCLLIDNDINS